MPSCLLDPAVYDCLLPRPAIRTVDWSEGHVPAPPPVVGKIRWDLFPYLTEPLDCMDSSDYDRVTLQMASRTGKTTAVQCFALRIVDTHDRNVAWGEPDKPSLQRVMRRTWTMANGTIGLSAKCPAHRLQSSLEMRFRTCLIHGAYSGSVSSASDYSAQVVVLNELSKYTHRRSLDSDGEDVGEAQFSQLLAERTKGHAGSTVVEMSTPTVKGRCRIEAARLRGDNRRYLCPCPFCGHYQTLRTGRSAAEKGGIKFEKNADGKLDPAVAEETAFYQCEKCNGKILDEHRYSMIGAGRWLKHGQTLDKRGRVRGRPDRTGRHASFGPLGTHYSLLAGITWGRIAREYVEALTDPLSRSMRNFVNSWEAETFNPRPTVVHPHSLAKRLSGDTDRGMCPVWSAFLTIAADVGGPLGDEFYWMVVAWGPVYGERFANLPRKRGHVIDWGVAFGEEEFLSVLANAKYDHADGGTLRWMKGAVDSGYQGRGTDDTAIYELCDGVKNLWPLKGSSGSFGADFYQFGFKRSGVGQRRLRFKQKHGIGDLLLVNTPLSQSWRHHLVSGRTKRGDENWCGLPADTCGDWEAHADFLDELLADRLIDGRWENLRHPSEFGDAIRYNRAIAELHTRGGKLWGKLVRESENKPKKETQSKRVNPPPWVPDRPGGWVDRP